MAEYDYDAVIIGAGHNGLTAAGYIAKEGLKTLVLERRDIVGGLCVTQEIEPGFKFNLAATGFASWLSPEVMKDLELERFGLELIPHNAMYTNIFPDGRYCTIYHDLDDSHREFARFSTRDADAYVELMKRWQPLKDFMSVAAMNPPPSIVDFVGLMASSPDMLDTFREMMFGTLKKFLDDYFESDYVKCTLMVESMDASHLGPTAENLSKFIYHLGLAPQWSASRGGMGSITQAMAKAVEHYAGTVRTGAMVERILVRDGKAIGVRLSTGEEITAKIVISNVSPQQTFQKMVGTEYLDAKFLQRVGRLRAQSTGITLNLALSKLPDFNMPEQRLKGWFAVCPSWQYAEKAWYEYTVHEIPEEPLLLGLVSSYFDDTVAPSGKHAAHVYVWPMPYDLAKGNWDERREEVYDRAINVLAKYAPNVRKALISCYGWTPLDLEREVGAPRGDSSQCLTTWEQMLFFRPLIGYTDYRTPIVNLYLCGSGTHPSGAVRGICGHNAAHVALADWKGKKTK